MIRWQWVTIFWLCFFPLFFPSVLFHWLVLLSMKCNWGRSVNLLLTWYLVIVCSLGLLFCLFCLVWFLISFVENLKPGNFLYLYTWCLNPHLQQRRQFLWEKTDVIKISTSIQELPRGKPKYPVSYFVIARTFVFLSFYVTSLLPFFTLSSTIHASTFFILPLSTARGLLAVCNHLRFHIQSVILGREVHLTLSHIHTYVCTLHRQTSMNLSGPGPGSWLLKEIAEGKGNPQLNRGSHSVFKTSEQWELYRTTSTADAKNMPNPAKYKRLLEPVWILKVYWERQDLH